MNANERDEITASVAAHAELGPRYDSAVAEGLVERIGEEIDRRIDSRLGGGPWPGQPTQSSTVPPAYQGPPTYQGQPAYQGPIAAPPGMPVAAPPSSDPVPRRSNGVTGMILGLGSLGLGVGATSVVVSHHPGAVAGVLMILLIWAAIAVINAAHSWRS